MVGFVIGLAIATAIWVGVIVVLVWLGRDEWSR